MLLRKQKKILYSIWPKKIAIENFNKGRQINDVKWISWMSATSFKQKLAL